MAPYGVPEGDTEQNSLGKLRARIAPKLMCDNYPDLFSAVGIHYFLAGEQLNSSPILCLEPISSQANTFTDMLKYPNSCKRRYSS